MSKLFFTTKRYVNKHRIEAIVIIVDKLLCEFFLIFLIKKIKQHTTEDNKPIKKIIVNRAKLSDLKSLM